MSINDKQSLSEEIVAQIQDYYNKALKFIQKNDTKSATKVLHNEMPVILYDLSLDIMDNRNADFSQNDLRELIIMVYNMLEQPTEVDEQSDILDSFQNNIF